MHKNRTAIAVGLTLSAAFMVVGGWMFSVFGLIWAGIISYCLIVGRGAVKPSIALSLYAAIILLPAAFIAPVGAVFAMGFIAPVVVGIYKYFAATEGASHH